MPGNTREGSAAKIILSHELEIESSKNNIDVKPYTDKEDFKENNNFRNEYVDNI